MTMGRSGSTSLMKALTRHSDIAGPSKNVASDDEELLRPAAAWRYAQEYSALCGRLIATPNELIESFFALNRGCAYAGFKSMPQRHDDYAQFIARDDIQFITLDREDLPSTVASFLLAERTGAWRRAGEAPPARWTFRSEDRLRVAQLVEYVLLVRQRLAEIPRAIHLTYEQLCDPQFSHAPLDGFFDRPIRLPDPRPATHASTYTENWEEFCALIAELSPTPAALNPSVPSPQPAPRRQRIPHPDLDHLTPQQRLRQEIPLIATEEEVQAQYEVSLLQAEQHAAEFQSLRTFCLFIGYPRSGHSLLGSLLDAHPNMIVAHELDVLRFLDAGFSAPQLYALLLNNSQRFAKMGRRWGEYRYAVPGQHQGAFTRLEVIGDKQGGRTSVRIGANPQLLERLLATVRLNCRFIHVVRNPFDVIATAAVKQTGSPAAAAEQFSRMCQVNAWIKQAVGAEQVFELHHEDFVGQPQAWLRRLCAFLGVAADEEYLRACAAIVFPEPRKSRGLLKWSQRDIDAVHRWKDRFAFLRRYHYAD